jgi:hypothetical protein
MCPKPLGDCDDAENGANGFPFVRTHNRLRSHFRQLLNRGPSRADVGLCPSPQTLAAEEFSKSSYQGVAAFGFNHCFTSGLPSYPACFTRSRSAGVIAAISSSEKLGSRLPSASRRRWFKVTAKISCQSFLERTGIRVFRFPWLTPYPLRPVDVAIPNRERAFSSTPAMLSLHPVPPSEPDAVAAAQSDPEQRCLPWPASFRRRGAGPVPCMRWLSTASR